MKALASVLASVVLAAGLASLFSACQNQMSAVPAKATLMASGHSDAEYLAPVDGKLYIYDKTRDKMVYSGPVLAGDGIKVDAPVGRIFVDDRPVAEHILLDAGSEYQFFIMWERPVAIQRGTATEEIGHGAPIGRPLVTEKE